MKLMRKLVIAAMSASLLVSMPASAAFSLTAVKDFVVKHKKPIIITTGVGLIAIGAVVLLALKLNPKANNRVARFALDRDELRNELVDATLGLNATAAADAQSVVLNQQALDTATNSLRTALEAQASAPAQTWGSMAEPLSSFTVTTVQ